jgi:hypothetical protein
MNDKPENGLPGYTTQREQIAQIIHHLVNIEKELQKHQSAHPNFPPPPNFAFDLAAGCFT